MQRRMRRRRSGARPVKQAAKGIGALLRAASRVVGLALGALAKLFGRAGRN